MEESGFDLSPGEVDALSRLDENAVKINMEKDKIGMTIIVTKIQHGGKTKK